MSGLIIEGVCASGKSMIYKGLSNKQSYIEKQSKIQLSEYLTERIIENIKPSVQDRVNLLNGYVNIFSTIYSNFYNSRFKNTKSSRVKPCFLVERFHFTHAVETMNFEAFREIDIKLKEMDFKLLVLTMKEEAIKKRIEDTFPKRPQTWYNYVMSFGGIDGAVKRYSIMQKRLLEYTTLTSLPVKIIDTTGKEWRNYIDEAERYWKI